MAFTKLMGSDAVRRNKPSAQNLAPRIVFGMSGNGPSTIASRRSNVNEFQAITVMRPVAAIE